MATIGVRYIVNDVAEAMRFYTTHLGFAVVMHPAPAFAILSRGDLRLMLSSPEGAGGGAQPAVDGRHPEPGGWNRFQIEVPDLAAAIAPLRQAGVPFRSDIITGIGAKQVLVDDPSGNPVELVELLQRG